MVNKRGQITPDYSKPNNKKAIFLIVGILVVISIVVFVAVKFFIMKPPQEQNIGETVNSQVEKIISNCLASKGSSINLEFSPFIKKDISICNDANTTSLKEQCEANFYFFELFENSFSDCSSVGNANIKTICEIVKTGDDSRCSETNYQGFNQFICLAIVNKDETKCLGVNDDKSQKICKNTFYLYNAMKSKDSSICNSLIEFEESNSLNSQKSKCLLLVNKNIDEYENQLDNRCKNEEIAATMEPSACDYVPSEYKSSCKDKITGVNNCISSNAEISSKKDCINKIIYMEAFCGEYGGMGPVIDIISQEGKETSIKKEILSSNTGLC